MSYSDELLEHWRRPRNWGSYHRHPPDDSPVLIGRCKCEPYNDVLFMTFKLKSFNCPYCSTTCKVPDQASNSSDIEFVNCDFCERGIYWIIEEVKHVSIGCGALIASSSWLSEYLKGRRVREAMSLGVDWYINRLELPYSATHCASILREVIVDAFYDYFKSTLP